MSLKCFFYATGQQSNTTVEIDFGDGQNQTYFMNNSLISSTGGEIPFLEYKSTLSFYRIKQSSSPRSSSFYHIALLQSIEPVDVWLCKWFVHWYPRRFVWKYECVFIILFHVGFFLSFATICIEHFIAFINNIYFNSQWPISITTASTITTNFIINSNDNNHTTFVFVFICFFNCIIN